MYRIGLLLAGCGLLEGSDPTQTVALHIAIAESDSIPIACAPAIPQADSRHPVTGAALPDVRDAFVEAARLVRGDCRPADRVQPAHIDALVVPGGLGAVKTLCRAAIDGHEAVVDPDVSRLLESLISQRKPVGVLDEAAVLLASAVRGRALTFALSGDPVLRAHLEGLGHRCVDASSGRAPSDDALRPDGGPPTHDADPAAGGAPATAWIPDVVVDDVHRVVSAMTPRDLDAAAAARPARAVLARVLALLGEDSASRSG